MNLEAFRRGWARWCRLDSYDDCSSTSERAGFLYASRCNSAGLTPQASVTQELSDMDIAAWERS